MSQDTGGRGATPRPATYPITESDGSTHGGRLVRVEYAIDPRAARAFADAAGQRSAAVRGICATIASTAEAVRLTGGDMRDVAAAVTATRRVLVHALAGAIGAELGGDR